MSSYLRNHGTRGPTPQSEPIRPDQVENSAGGFVWEVNKWTRLARWLILGSEGGSFYATERDLTTSNVNALRECLAEDGVKLVNEIVSVSEAGRAVKNDQAIFALAYAVAEGDDATKKAALAALPRVCRIGTHLFMFIDFLDGSFGKATGRAKRRALGEWYLGKTPDDVAYQMVKYRQRGGWSHRDVLRLAHPRTESKAHRDLFAWVTGKVAGSGDERAPVGALIDGFEQAQRAQTADEVARLVTEYRLPREALPTEFLKDAKVWDAMLQNKMPMTAMIRNLATMSRIGVLTPTSEGTRTVLGALSDEKAIRKARVHPMSLLFALRTYQSGYSYRGTSSWVPVPQIVDALDSAFYLAFGNVEVTNKRWLFGLDVSGSMASQMGDTNISCAEGATAMALVTAAVEPLYECVSFSNGPGAWRKPHGQPHVHGGYSSAFDNRYSDGLEPFPISKRQRLDDVMNEARSRNMGGTDCSLPMQFALALEREVDVFVIYTDSETWAGGIHPVQALQEYRRQSGIEARLVVVGMVANRFSIADPNDAGMLDCVGFDAGTPNVISDFALGRI